jgi:dTDP-glucose 4,6-dehydratase
VTGGAGFIGSNFIRYILKNHDDVVVINLDKLTYAGNLKNLKDVDSCYGGKRYFFIKGDICDRKLVNSLFSSEYFSSQELISKSQELKIDVCVNFAAESHVDRSILDPSPFIKTNVEGTQVLLEAARNHWDTKTHQPPTTYRSPIFLQVSTDEVYGSLGARGKFTEESPLLPNSPYSASKAAADCLCRAYYHTYGLPVIITRCSNNYGPFQFPEKLIPVVITNALKGKEIPVYGDGLNVRDWIYVEDHCRAIDLIIQQGKIGEIYNIGGNCEKTNLELVHCILNIMGKPRSLITFVADRPGHDRRYALDTTKISRELGWRASISFEEGLKNTIEWYKRTYV